MHTDAKVLVVIVTYNGRKWIDKCLRSLNNSAVPADVVVIDNGSTDGTQEIIAQFGCVRFIQSGENIGFGKANNIGMQIALENRADYVFLLNQDAYVDQDTVLQLLRTAKENTGFGIISPLHLNGSGTALDLNFSAQLAPDKCPGFYSDLYVNRLKGIYEIEFVNAAAWLISAECIRTVGFFEPLFFLYGEDNNYLQRVTYHGLKIGIAPQSRIYHDRETRAGKMNDTGLKIAERTNSLLRLLNILQSYRTAILFFLKDRGYLLLKKIYEGKLAQTKDEFAEILFLVKNYRKLKRLRAGYKMEAAKRDESKD